MRETIKIAGLTAVVQKLRRARWPDGAWIVFSGSDEATGSTRENAIYNFERMVASSVPLQQGNSHD